jgi:hypothetical protein
MISDTFEVRHPELEARLKEMGDHLRRALGDQIGFSLFLFEFQPGGSLFYTSNCAREDIVRAMKEFIALQEQN